MLRYRAIDRRSKGRESPPSRRNRREVPIYGKGEEKLCVATLIGSEGPFGGGVLRKCSGFPSWETPQRCVIDSVDDASRRRGIPRRGAKRSPPPIHRKVTGEGGGTLPPFGGRFAAKGRGFMEPRPLRGIRDKAQVLIALPFGVVHSLRDRTTKWP